MVAGKWVVGGKLVERSKKGTGGIVMDQKAGFGVRWKTLEGLQDWSGRAERGWM